MPFNVTRINTLDSRSVNKRYMSGLTLSNNGSDLTNDIDIAVGEAMDTTGLYQMQLPSILTKRLDFNWTVGTNQGGLDTGVKTAGTTYFVFLIQRLDTGVVDAIFSASLTPTLPTGYTISRRIGAVFTNGSNAITRFIQSGDEFMLYTQAQVSAGVPPTAGTLISCAVPSGLVVAAKVWVSVFRIGGGTTNGLVTSPLGEDSVPSASLFNLRSIESAGNYIDSMPTALEILTNTSKQIRIRFDAANNNYWVHSVGWRDIGLRG